MIQNHEQISDPKSGLRINGLNGAQLNQVSYNLAIGKIIDSLGNEHETYNLPPQGIVNVVSKELLELPNNLVAYATIKNGMSRKGLLAINIGIIDPGYNGMVASHLINFGREAIEIKSGQVFLRLTFHKLDLPKVNKSIKMSYSEEEYIEQRKTEARAYLGISFLGLEKAIGKIKSDVSKRLIKDLLTWAVILGLLITGISFGVSFAIKPANEGGAHKNLPELKALEARIQALEGTASAAGTSEKKGSQTAPIPEEKKTDGTTQPQENEN